jgi:hypothetical protein
MRRNGSTGLAGEFTSPWLAVGGWWLVVVFCIVMVLIGMPPG